MRVVNKPFCGGISVYKDDDKGKWGYISESNEIMLNERCAGYRILAEAFKKVCCMKTYRLRLYNWRLSHSSSKAYPTLLLKTAAEIELYRRKRRVVNNGG